METERGPTEKFEYRSEDFETLCIGEDFETLCIPTSGWLVMHDHIPRFRRDGNNILLVFKAKDKLFEDLNAYTRGDHCNANQFAQVCKQLKGRILSMKNGDRNRNGNSHHYRPK